MGGWNSVDKAANAMQAMGLMNLDDDDYNKDECDVLNNEVHFLNKVRYEQDYYYRLKMQTKM